MMALQHAGARSCCQAMIKQHAPRADYIHCAAHRLNLATVSACQIQAFRKCESFNAEIARYFKFSAKKTMFIR